MLQSVSPRASRRSPHRSCAAAGARTAVRRTMPDGFIGGTVTSDARSRSGRLGHRARPTELKTPFIKIVVTDDGGPLRAAAVARRRRTTCGCAATASPTPTTIEGRPGDTGAEPHGEASRATLGRSREGLSRQLLVVAAPAARCEPSSRARVRQRQRHSRRRMARRKAHWIFNLKSALQFLPSARQRDHAHAGSHGSLGVRRRPRKRGSYRTQLGVRGSAMAGTMAQSSARENAGARVLAGLDRRAVADGEVPPAPPRPRPGRRAQRRRDALGLGRRHRRSCTTRSRPTRTIPRSTATGPCTRCPPGTASSPCSTRSTTMHLRAHDPDARGSRARSHSRFPPPAMPSNFWGMQHLWGLENPADPHNPMMDRKGRVWMTSKIRDEEPAWCREGSRQQVRAATIR